MGQLEARVQLYLERTRQTQGHCQDGAPACSPAAQPLQLCGAPARTPGRAGVHTCTPLPHPLPRPPGCKRNALPRQPPNTVLPPGRCDNTTSGLACRARCAVGVGSFISLCTRGTFGQWSGGCVRPGAHDTLLACLARTCSRPSALPLRSAPRRHCLPLASCCRMPWLCVCALRCCRNIFSARMLAMHAC